MTTEQAATHESKQNKLNVTTFELEAKTAKKFKKWLNVMLWCNIVDIRFSLT